MLSHQILCHECQNTDGSYQCLCDAGYTNSIVNETFITCEGECNFESIMAAILASLFFYTPGLHFSLSVFIGLDNNE